MKVLHKRQVVVQPVPHLYYMILCTLSVSYYMILHRLAKYNKNQKVSHWWDSVGHAETSQAWNKHDVDKLENEKHFVVDPDGMGSDDCKRDIAEIH